MYSISQNLYDEFIRATKKVPALRVGQAFCNIMKLHKSPALHHVDQVLWHLDGEEAHRYIADHFVIS